MILMQSLKRNKLRDAILVALWCVLAGASPLQAARPNIVLIMADDLGYGDLSCYNGWINTPNIDALAKIGIRFTDFHTSGSVCSPTRAGLMTGRYQERAGIGGVVYARLDADQHYHGLQASEFTIAELCKERGYSTAIFGKWHLGYYAPYNPVNHGFDEFTGYVSGNVDFFSHVDQAGVYDWWHGLETVEEKGYTTHLITRHAVEFISKSGERPFFLYIPHEAPHYPYQGPSDPAIRSVGSTDKINPERSDVKNAYTEMVTEMDRGIGEVLAALTASGKRDNTIVIFMSDNGANKNGSNGSLRGFKGSVWEGGHRVPAIISWPGQIRPRIEGEFCTSLDWMPTIASLLKTSSQKEKPFDGVDLKDLLLKDKRIRETQRTFVWKGNAVRRGDYKWVKEKDREFLFDIANDPNETKNIIDQRPDLAAELRKAAVMWQQDMKASSTPQPSKSELLKRIDAE